VAAAAGVRICLNTDDPVTESRFFLRTAALAVRGGPGGMKMANGENPKRAYGRRNKAPATRMKIMALQREILLKAKEYAAKWERWRQQGEGERPQRDLALEPVVEILQGRRTVHFHTHRADDILSALRLKDEFGFELVLHHVTEAYLVPAEIARRKVPCSLTLVDSPGGKPEALNLRYRNPAVAAAAGVRICLNTDDPVTESRFFLRTAALAVRGGPISKSVSAPSRWARMPIWFS
jgi:imidazolonepropionase-like amidohydrolase